MSRSTIDTRPDWDFDPLNRVILDHIIIIIIL